MKTETNLILYKVYDEYEGYRDFLGAYQSKAKARLAIIEREHDTDGECNCVIEEAKFPIPEKPATASGLVYEDHNIYVAFPAYGRHAILANTNGDVRIIDLDDGRTSPTDLLDAYRQLWRGDWHMDDEREDGLMEFKAWLIGIGTDPEDLNEDW